MWIRPNFKRAVSPNFSSSLRKAKACVTLEVLKLCPTVDLKNGYSIAQKLLINVSGCKWPGWKWPQLENFW